VAAAGRTKVRGAPQAAAPSGRKSCQSHSFALPDAALFADRCAQPALAPPNRIPETNLGEAELCQIAWAARLTGLQE